MRYTETLATQVAQEFGISAFTKSQWKKKMRIPDRYFEKEPPAERTEADDMIRILSLPCLNIIQIANISGNNSSDPEVIEGISYSHLKDVVRGKAYLTDAQVKELRSVFEAVKAVLIQISEAAESGNRIEFWKAWYLLPIKWATLLPNRTEYYRLMNRKAQCALPGRMQYFRKEVEKLIVTLEKSGI